MTKRELIEKKYGMSFKSFIEEYHWSRGLSFSEIEAMTGIFRQSLTDICDKLNIKRKTHAQSIKPKIGKDHWAFGLNKKNSKPHRQASKRMRLNNPTFDLDVRIRAALKRADTFRLSPWPQEKAVIDLLDSLGATYEFQYPIGPFVIDFFFPKIKLCLEIDSVKKWGKERRMKAAKKDSYLLNLGYKVVRVDKRYVNDLTFMIDVLNASHIIGDKKLIRSNPTPTG